MNTPHLLIRADAGPDIGIGHVMRCLALAQQWQEENGTVTFLMHCEAPALRQRIHSEGFGIIDIPHPHPNPLDLAQTLSLLQEYCSAEQPLWLALDGYHFDPGYQKAVRATGCRTLVLDDTNHWPEYHADILLNQNIGANDIEYAAAPDTILALGCNFALIRREFLSLRDTVRPVSQTARNILVTVGGADPLNITQRIIDVLMSLNEKDLSVTVVSGPTNPHSSTLKMSLSRAALTSRILHGASNMAELMAWADIVITAAGSTCWETACLGLPTVLLTWADNQNDNATRLHKKGISLHAGRLDKSDQSGLTECLRHLIPNANLRARLANKARDTVDGGGVARIRSLARFRDGEPIDVPQQIRKAKRSDSRALWRLANDPKVRTNSFSPEAIPLASHNIWFKKKTHSSSTRLYILDIEGLVIGQIRYEKTGEGTAQIDYSIHAAFRGSGLGTKLIEATLPLATKDLAVKQFVGITWADNAASQACFLKNAFCVEETKAQSDKTTIKFSLEVQQ